MNMIMLLILLCLQYNQALGSANATSNLVENAALNKPARQISTYSSGVASKAVDGNKNPRYSDGSCTHTLWKEGLPLYQWWMVDLEREYIIKSVNITNRLNSDERQRDFDIFVSLNSTFEEDDHMTDERLCMHVSGRMGRGETRKFTCQTPVCGRFVQIYMVTLDERDMNICEVTVQGYKATCSNESTVSTALATQTPSAAMLSTTTPTSTSTVLSTTVTTPTTTTTTSASSAIPTTTSETVKLGTATPLPASTTLKTAATTTSVATTSSKTTSSKTNSKLFVLPSNNTTPATPMCPCTCGVSSNTANLTKDALVQLVKDLQKEMTVNKKETSISKRKLISVGDERESAETIGFIGVLALCVPVLLIVSFDLINLWSFCKRT